MYNRAQFMKDLKASKAPKKLKKPKDIIVDPAGQWAHPGEVTKIPSSHISMHGIPYPVMGVDNTGHAQMMHPGAEYHFPGDMVTEYPMAHGGQIYDRVGRLHSIKSYVPWAQDGGPSYTGAQTAEDSSLVRTYFNRAFNRSQPSEDRYLELKRAIEDGSINLLTSEVKRGALLEYNALKDAFGQKRVPNKAEGGPSPAKAKEMLRDGTAHGKPLTSKQKRYFGWLSHKKQYGGWLDDYNP